MALSEARKKANEKWNAKNIKRFSIAAPIEKAEQIEMYCNEKGISKNLFFVSAALEKIERDQ